MKTDADSAAADGVTAGKAPAPTAAVHSVEDRLVYRDVPKSKDIKCVRGAFAFGGDYQLKVYKLTGDDEAGAGLNRTEVELPAAEAGAAGSSRKRRVMRAVKDVVATEDAHEALLIWWVRGEVGGQE